MATKRAKGMLSDPPKVRSQSRNSARRSKSKSKGPRGPGGVNDKYPGLNPNLQGLVNQNVGSDIKLGEFGGEMLSRVQGSYSQPMSWEGLPEAPGMKGANAYIEGLQNQFYDRFKSRMEPQFQQESEDFEQQMANRGIPMGSQLYEQQKTAMTQRQQDARLNAQAQAAGDAANQASTFFGIGQGARSSALGERMMQRSQPLEEYNAIMGSRSGMGQEAFQHSQNLDVLGRQADEQIRVAKNVPRGGGGGGGPGPVWSDYGFPGPREYDEYRRNQEREDQQWNWENNPAYRKPKQPNPYAAAAGGILGSAAQGAAQGYMMG